MSVYSVRGLLGWGRRLGGLTVGAMTLVQRGMRQGGVYEQSQGLGTSPVLGTREREPDQAADDVPRLPRTPWGPENALGTRECQGGR